MNRSGFRKGRRILGALTLAVLGPSQSAVLANPAGGTVTQGSASFSSQGSQLTITTSAQTGINWQSFNIGLGETTTFVQPSSSSVVWNQINDPNPSQILGNLNANGFVVLQNSSGFVVGGQAAVTARGLIMSTARMPMPDLAGGGPWDFHSLPPSASIINYGQIKAGNAGSVYLIADHVENHGKISANGGTIGLCAGQDVMLSERPDGRGLSAHVTLPEGSVDNSGKLIADAGQILMQAQVVNQGGLVQANSVKNVNGTIELLASDSIHLGSKSVISARGGKGVSAGGEVVVKSDGSFSDDLGSRIDIRGGTRGGNGGQAEVSAPWMSSLNSDINGRAINNYIAGQLSLDPLNIILASSSSDPNAQYSGTVLASDPPTAGTLTLDVTKFSKSLSLINLAAVNDIELTTIWNLYDPGVAATLTLTAGNDIIFDNGAGIRAIAQDASGNATGKNYWTVNLNAGVPGTASRPGTGTQGIYLLGNSFIQTMNGDINLSAMNDVLVNAGTDGVNDGNPVFVTKVNGTSVDALSSGTPGNNGIRTTKGGNIKVTALYGDVFTGGNVNGFQFGQSTKPFYRVNPNAGGISTLAGGNVDIHAGQDVVSYLPRQSDSSNAKFDAGSGAFGPGNVTITAGGSIFGHFILANGVGTITAGTDPTVASTAGADIGAPTSVAQSNPYLGFALSLITGYWNVSAPNGNIYVQDVRNPNGIFGERPNSSPDSYAGYHYFDYNPYSAVSFHAGQSVEITGFDAPHVVASVGTSIPILLPPSLQVTTGSGDFILDVSVILFPSPFQGLNLSIARDLVGVPDAMGNPVNLEMSDKDVSTVALARWTDEFSFQPDQHAALPPELNNLNPVMVNVGRDVNDVNFYVTKAADINVGRDLNNSGFHGENLHRGDVTSIDVHGSIYNSPLYSFETLTDPITSANGLAPDAWDSVFVLALNPNLVGSLTSLNVTDPKVIGANGLAYFLKQHGYLLFPSDPSQNTTLGQNPGFFYDVASLQLAFKGNMSRALSVSQISALENGSFSVLRLDAQGNPVIDANGHLQVATYNFSAASAIAGLYTQSLQASTTTGIGYSLGGPGKFNLHASSIDLGNSAGISSYGFGSDYASLQPLCGAIGIGGAAINVSVDGDLNMLTSSIKAIDGGDVNVNVGGSVNLSRGTFDFRNNFCYGIYTTGLSDVNVIARGDVNVGSACIATFNGGHVFIKSLDGDVSAGNGANRALLVYGIQVDPATGAASYQEMGDLADAASLAADPAPYGSGILAESPTARFQIRGNSLPGNITVETPNGNITSGQGGISQFALNGSVAAGPVVSLVAGTPGVAATPDQGNIYLGQGGIVGGTINITAPGVVQGLVVSRQDANINAGQSFSGTVLSGGNANFSGSGNISGTVVGIGGVNVSGGGAISGTVLSQNVSIGGAAAVSTLATSSGATASSQAAAQQATSDTQQQVGISNNQGNDDDEKKKHGKHPTTRRSRVTVLLPPRQS